MWVSPYRFASAGRVLCAFPPSPLYEYAAFRFDLVWNVSVLCSYTGWKWSDGAETDLLETPVGV